MKVLIVDDTREDRYLLETLLSRNRYEVATAGNGIEALEKVSRDGFERACPKPGGGTVHPQARGTGDLSGDPEGGDPGSSRRETGIGPAPRGRGTVIGVEALIRWRHPLHGMIEPMEFILPAEKTGLIQWLTLWVVNAAQRQSRLWQRDGIEIPASVNLSARNLHDPKFPELLERRLREYGGRPERLELEITESTIMLDPERALEATTSMRRLGFRFAIDDFGTGYSSLAYLQKLPVDTIKIDKSFVLHMATNANDAMIVRSTVDLGHNLGLQVGRWGIGGSPEGRPDGPPRMKA